MGFKLPNPDEWGSTSIVMRMLITLILFSLPEFTSLWAMDVHFMRIPDSGIQPQVKSDTSGNLHMVYYVGEASAGDLLYVTRDKRSTSWSNPIRVNTNPQAAVAGGTIRGAHMSIGMESRIHVSWFGSAKVSPKPPEGKYPQAPLMVTRLNDAGDGFEPERNVMTWTRNLDGGGSIAADQKGNVFVAWHGRGHSKIEGEPGRGIFLATSGDQGKTFTKEVEVKEAPPGSCACCGMRVLIHPMGQLHLVYRGVQQKMRPMIDLWSNDGGKTFQKIVFNPWEIEACPMSSVDLLPMKDGILIASEQAGDIKLNRKPLGQSTLNPLSDQFPKWKGKHPSIATDPTGNLLVTWAEGAGWAKGGTLRWVILDKNGGLIAGNESGKQPEIPVWSFPSAHYFNQQFGIIF